jgi:hypothetical protein
MTSINDKTPSPWGEGVDSRGSTQVSGECPDRARPSSGAGNGASRGALLSAARAFETLTLGGFSTVSSAEGSQSSDPLSLSPCHRLLVPINAFNSL